MLPRTIKYIDDTKNGATYLKLGEICPLKEHNEARDQVGINHLLNRRIFLLREKSPEANRCENHSQIILVIDQSKKLLEVSNL